MDKCNVYFFFRFMYFTNILLLSMVRILLVKLVISDRCVLNILIDHLIFLSTYSLNVQFLDELFIVKLITHIE